MLTTAKMRIFTCGMLLLVAVEVSAQTTLVPTPGSDPAATLVGAVRFRNFSSAGIEKEMWVGVPPLNAPPAPDESADFSWSLRPRISFSYRPDSGLLTAGASTNPDFGVPQDLALVQKLIGTVGPLNYLQITVTTLLPDAHVLFGGVLTPPGRDPFGGCAGCLLVGLNGQTTGTYTWHVTGIDLTEGFSFDGGVEMASLMAGGDVGFVEVAFGYLPPPDTTGPLSSQLTVGPTPVLLNGNATLAVKVDDSTTGNNTISSATYTLNGTFAGPLTALDGSFNETSELVHATLSATRLGINEVCVQATDSLDNTGPALCQQFLVTYKFAGFSSPIDNTLVNGAVAGQTIPVRWRLSDANDVPVSETVQQLASYPINCSDSPDDFVDAIEEYAPGSSGLLYSGDGRWQLNWKTPASYANTCRAMYIAFANGATSPVVKFKFK